MAKENPYTGVTDPEVVQVGDGENVKTAIPVAEPKPDEDNVIPTEEV